MISFNSLIKQFVSVMLSVFIALPVLAESLNEDNDDDWLCKGPGYTVAFFNGIQTTRTQADGNIKELRKTFYGGSYKGERVRYQVFYNNTEGFTKDLVEVFVQRALEINPILADRFELLGELLAAMGNDSMIESIINNTSDTKLQQAIRNFQSSLRDSIIANGVLSITELLNSPPQCLEQNYAEHRTMIDKLLIEGEKLVFVAHSQGNLFVNPAYDYAVNKSSSQNVKVVHVAPASAVINGDYVLARQDLVIAAVGVTGFIQPHNVSIAPLIPLPKPEYLNYDIKAHNFIKIYLNSKFPARAMVKSIYTQALDEVVPYAHEDNQGFFTSILTWDGYGDVDLHILEPKNTHVYFGSKNGLSGYLDYDNTVADGPEHYFASCNKNALQTGAYTFGITNYNRAEGRKATLQIASDRDGLIFSETFDVGNSTGSGAWQKTTPVVKVQVDVDDGKYKVKAIPITEEDVINAYIDENVVSK